MIALRITALRDIGCRTQRFGPGMRHRPQCAGPGRPGGAAPVQAQGSLQRKRSTDCAGWQGRQRQERGEVF